MIDSASKAKPVLGSGASDVPGEAAAVDVAAVAVGEIGPAAVPVGVPVCVGPHETTRAAASATARWRAARIVAILAHASHVRAGPWCHSPPGTPQLRNRILAAPNEVRDRSFPRLAQ